jgi:hypothetical protein
MPQLVENIGGIGRMDSTMNDQHDAFAQDKINRMIGTNQFGHLVRMRGGTATFPYMRTGLALHPLRLEGRIMDRHSFRADGGWLLRR